MIIMFNNNNNNNNSDDDDKLFLLSYLINKPIKNQLKIFHFMFHFIICTLSFYLYYFSSQSR